MNPYHEFVAAFARLVTEGKTLPLGAIPPHGKPGPPPQAPVALIFSPHPDDECITGGLALRLLRETGMRVVNLAVTLGRNRQRQQSRWQELQSACGWLGFELVSPPPEGLQPIDLETRSSDPAHWAGAVEFISGSLVKHQPAAIFFPHELDWNRAHVGTHFLVLDALQTLPASFSCFLVETEFWGQMPSPNLMVESSVDDVADLLAALSFHVGEVQRNPYHLRMPAWLQDNVRRGAELIGGQGAAAPDFQFATLYRARQWKQGGIQDVYAGGRQIGVRDNPGAVFG